jgi:hypothetical protein
MRRPVADHRNPAWQVHELARDFELLDVWRFPIRVGGAVDFATVVDFLDETQAAMTRGSSLAASLFRLRDALGRIFGWDERAGDLSIPGSEETSIRDRLPQDARCDPGAEAGGDASPESAFELVYLTESESLREIKNATVHALLHLARVPLDPADPTGPWAPQMAVYVKPRGRLGRFYMALISPFRHLVVYPTMMRAVAEAWPDYVARHGLERPRGLGR